METGKWGSWHSLPSSTPQEPFPKGLALFRPLLCPQHTGRTEAWKVLSPQGSPWDSVARVLPNGSLLLPAVGIPDEGIFRCRAMSRKGKEIKSNYQVRVYRKGSGLPQGPPSFQEEPSTPALAPWLALVVGEPSKPQLLTGILPPSEIPGKPEIVDPASELQAGVPNKVVGEKGRRVRTGGGWVRVYGVLLSKVMRSLFPQVGTCVSEGGYPAGTLSWHLDGKPLIPDGKGESPFPS